MPIEPRDLLAVKLVGDVQVSPDGTRVAYTVTEVDVEADEYRSATQPELGAVTEAVVHGATLRVAEDLVARVDLFETCRGAMGDGRGARRSVHDGRPARRFAK